MLLELSGHSVLDWVPPDAYFSQAQVDAATAVIDRALGGQARIELAFLAGSLAVGLGHGTSDVDLYVVGSGLPGSEVVFEQDGVAVHVSPLTPTQVRELIALGSAYRATGADRSQLAVDMKTLHALVRLCSGWRLMVSQEWTEELSALREDVVRRILMARNANVFAAYAEDVDGALAADDLLTAAAASALALEAACEATLAAAGDLYVGPKFLFRRLARTPATAGWCDLLWRLYHHQLPSASATLPEDVRVTAKARLRAAGFLLSLCAVEGWERVITALPGIEALTAARAAPGPRRSVYFTPVRFADGWALIGAGDGYETCEGIVLLWWLLDGRPLPELVSALRQHDQTLQVEDIEAALSALRRIGAVHPAQGESPESAPERLGTPRLPLAKSAKFSCHPKAMLPAGEELEDDSGGVPAS